LLPQAYIVNDGLNADVCMIANDVLVAVCVRSLAFVPMLDKR